MGRGIRVFISSTMEDLVSERDAVRRKLEFFNLEPVNAEDIPARSDNSWETIRKEIEECDMFVLIVGGRYGWIPTGGPFANYIEFRHAKQLGLPILVFRKNPTSDLSDPNEVAKRNAFINEVRDWKAGGFSNDFKTAIDLANKVGRAVSATFADAFRERAKKQIVAAPSGGFAASKVLTTDHSRSISLPAQLIKSVANGKAVLFAGAGISMPAGLPSAAAFEDWMLGELNIDPNNSAAQSASFAAIASVFFDKLGRDKATKSIAELIGAPIFEPTPAHFQALQAFGRIVTTNYDSLFEKSLEEVNDKREVISKEFDADLPTQYLVKLHGSASKPDSLTFTEEDIHLLDQRKPHLWRHLVEQLEDSCVVAVGTSLADPSVRRLFADAAGTGVRYIVLPNPSDFFKVRMAAAGFELIDATANEFFASLKKYAPSSPDDN